MHVLKANIIASMQPGAAGKTSRADVVRPMDQNDSKSRRPQFQSSKGRC